MEKINTKICTCVCVCLHVYVRTYVGVCVGQVVCVIPLSVLALRQLFFIFRHNCTDKKIDGIGSDSDSFMTVDCNTETTSIIYNGPTKKPT